MRTRCSGSTYSEAAPGVGLVQAALGLQPHRMLPQHRQALLERDTSAMHHVALAGGELFGILFVFGERLARTRRHRPLILGIRGEVFATHPPIAFHDRPDHRSDFVRIDTRPVFDDPLDLTSDAYEENGEWRYDTLDRLFGELLVIVTHTSHMDEEGERVRLISARKADKTERTYYENDPAYP